MQRWVKVGIILEGGSISKCRVPKSIHYRVRARDAHVRVTRASPKSSQTFNHNISTTMTDINEALEYLNSLKLGEKFSYIEVAKKFGVVRSTLTRRH